MIAGRRKGSAMGKREMLGLAGVCILMGGCGLGKLVREAKDVQNPKATGALEMSGPVAGSVRFVPESCTSGDREYFLGVDLAAARPGIEVRALIEPLGTAVVRVRSPAAEGEGGGMVLFRHDDCRVLQLEVEPSGWRVNEVRDVSGFLELDCDSLEGDHVAGRIEMNHCH
jgi:hypothetical protein